MIILNKIHNNGIAFVIKLSNVMFETFNIRNEIINLIGWDPRIILNFFEYTMLEFQISSYFSKVYSNSIIYIKK